MTTNTHEDIQPTTISVYSDYTCPWCYIGLARLERLREEARVPLEIVWKPFEIHPEVPAEGMPVSALGYPPQRWEAMMESLRLAAAEEGLEMGNRPKVSNTHRALVASAYAQAEEPERFEAFHHALFHAYFAEGRDIGDAAVIRDVAEASGLDVSRMDAALDAGEYDPVLQETSQEARTYGITGTPTFVFGERYGLVGAQPTEELRRVLERVLEETRAETSDA